MSRSATPRLGDCPGHIASDTDPHVCGNCGANINEFREEPDDLEMLHMDAIRAVERYWEARRKANAP